MDEEKLNELAAKIAQGDCVLFAGAGLTIEDGGVSWDELVNRTQKKFGYNSPLTDNFQILFDIVQKNSEQEIHNFIKSQLSDISLSDPVARLAEMPWFATFTTNYDTALEDTLKERQDTRVRTVLTDGQFEISNSPSHLLCVKLMGSITREPGQSGSMVLTRGDRERAKDKRSRIFDMLASHASNLSFLFVGYSFSDDVFIDILERVISTSGIPDGDFYALFHSQKSEEEQYRLDQLGVNPIIGDIREFSKILSEKVAVRNP
ncbi:MAG: SIR2 family protein, partial [Candidatus Paceibacteria bacterium]